MTKAREKVVQDESTAKTTLTTAAVAEDTNMLAPNQMLASLQMANQALEDKVAMLEEELEGWKSMYEGLTSHEHSKGAAARLQCV